MDILRTSILEPLEYCQKWVDVPSEQRGYRKACITALAKATGLSETTIANWGKDYEKRPDNIVHSLSMADKLNRIRQIVSELDL